MEIKLAPDNPNIVLSFKSRVLEVAQPIFQVSKCRSNQLVLQLITILSRCMMLFCTTKEIGDHLNIYVVDISFYSIVINLKCI